MRRLLLSALAVSVLVLAACSDAADEDPLGAGDGATSSSPNRERDDGDREARPEIQVELLDAGAEPRQLLRLDPPDDCSQAVTLRNLTDVEISVAGEAQEGTNGVEYDLTYTCESVTDDSISVVSHYDDARLVDADPVARASLEKMLEHLVGAEGRIVYDRRGRILEVDAPQVEIDDDLLGAQFAMAMEQMLDSMETSIDQGASPFPDEPIGLGARWRVTGQMAFSGMQTQLVTEFVLTEVRPDRAAATSTLSMEFLPGPVDVPGFPGGAMEVVSGTFEGTGTASWDLRGVITLSQQSLAGETVMLLDDGSGGIEMRQSMRQETSITAR